MCRPFFSGTCLLMLLNVSTAAAQTEKGSKLIGATFGAASYTHFTSTTVSPADTAGTAYEQNGNRYSIFVGPSVGWFVKDNLAVGVSIGVSYSKSSRDVSSNTSTVTESITETTPSVLGGPFARYYFGGSASAKPFVGAHASLVFPSGRYEASVSTGETFESRVTPKGGYEAGLEVGYEQFLSKSVGLVFASGVNYAFLKYEVRNTSQYPFGTFSDTRTQTHKEWTIPFNVGLQIHFP